MSLFSEQLSGGFSQLHQGLRSSFPCAVLGRTFAAVHGRRAYEKKAADAGFISGADAVFDALNGDIVGLNLKGCFGQILTYKGQSFIVRRVEEGEVTTLFFCEAKNA